jgi:hypothetical protein
MVDLPRGPDDIQAHLVVREGVRPLGDALTALSRDLGLENDDFAGLEEVGDQTPAKPMTFE